MVSKFDEMQENTSQGGQGPQDVSQSRRKVSQGWAIPQEEIKASPAKVESRRGTQNDLAGASQEWKRTINGSASRNGSVSASRTSSTGSLGLPKGLLSKTGSSSFSSNSTIQGESSVQDGISLKFLKSFVDSHRKELNGLSTGEVCEKLIKPATERDSCSYLEVKRRQDASVSGPATVFISHVWTYNFLQLAMMVIDWCEANRIADDRCFLWLDIFVVNQHLGLVDYKHWNDRFPRSISRMKYVLVVLLPWQKSIWTRRAWCLFELWIVLHSRTKATFLLSKEDEVQFQTFVANGGRFEDVVGEVDINTAETTRPRDLEGIREVVMSSAGLASFNSRVTGAIRQWFIGVAALALDQAVVAQPGRDRTGLTPLLANVAGLYEAAGQYDKALPLLEKRLKALSAAVSSSNEQLLEVRQTLGRVYWRLARFDEAHKMFKEAINGAKRRSGKEGSAAAAEIVQNDANVFRDEGKHAEALRRYEEAWDLARKAHGSGGHPILGEILCNIGMARSALGKHSEGLADLNRALESQKKAVGEQSAEAAQTIWAMGRIYEHMEKVFEAQQEYEEALRVQKAVYGEQHPEIATTLVSIGDMLLAEYKPEEALEKYELALRMRRATLGSGHPSLAIALDGIARAQLQLGRHEASLSTYQESLRISRAALGDSHEAVGATMRGIGLVYDAQGDLGLALSSFRTALQIQKEALGEKHPAVAQTQYHMGDLLVRMRKPQEARDVLKDSHAVFNEFYGPSHSRTQDTFRKASTISNPRNASKLCTVS